MLNTNTMWHKIKIEIFALFTISKERKFPQRKFPQNFTPITIYRAIPNRPCKPAAISWRFDCDLSPLFRTCSNFDDYNFKISAKSRNMVTPNSRKFHVTRYTEKQIRQSKETRFCVFSCFDHPKLLH